MSSFDKFLFQNRAEFKQGDQVFCSMPDGKEYLGKICGRAGIPVIVDYWLVDFGKVLYKDMYNYTCMAVPYYMIDKV